MGPELCIENMCSLDICSFLPKATLPFSLRAIYTDGTYMYSYSNKIEYRDEHEIQNLNRPTQRQSFWPIFLVRTVYQMKHYDKPIFTHVSNREGLHPENVEMFL